MIALAPIDYVVMAVAVAVVALRITSDIRDVAAAKFTKNTMKFLKRKFLPKVTIVIPLESIESVKQTLEHLQEAPLPISTVVAIDAKRYPRGASALRYFVRKNAMKRVQVTARKNPDLTAIAGESSRTGLVAILPDTTRIHESFYQDAVLPFSDRRVDAVQLVPSTRADRTLSSGMEVLITAWRRYISLNGIRYTSSAPIEALLPGVVIRIKYARKFPKKGLHITSTRRAVYSILALPSARLAWTSLRKAVSVADYSLLAATVVIVALLSKGSYDLQLTVGVFVLLYAVLMWWSLGMSRISFVDRVAILLLAPFFPVAVFGFMIAQAAELISLLGRVAKVSFSRVHTRNRTASS